MDRCKSKQGMDSCECASRRVASRRETKHNEPDGHVESTGHMKAEQEITTEVRPAELEENSETIPAKVQTSNDAT